MRVWLMDQQVWAERIASGWATGDVRGSRLVVEGQQLIGPRQAAVAAPAGGTNIDAEARTAIEALISRLVAHGLLAP